MSRTTSQLGPRATGSDAPEAPVARVLGVSKRFGASQALRDVSLEIRRGESHALVGRNGAGKSTLVGVLTGLVQPDAGEVWLEGEPAPAFGERERWRARVACVYQRSTVIPTLTVGENLFLGDHPGRRHGFVSWRELRRRAREVLDEWGIEVDAEADASTLSVEERELVEIARALLLGTRFIILDEPTAHLEARGIARLFDRVRRLQERGVTFLYISHHLEEIYEICQRVTVLRDGQVVATAPVAEMPKEQVIGAMVGNERSVGERRRGGAAEPVADGEARLAVRDLTFQRWFRNVSFEVRQGERVGLAGLAGSGKAQVADAVVGLVRPDSGEVRVAGRVLAPGRVDEAIAAGVGYVPEDRHARGLVPQLGIDENVTLTILGRLGRAGLVEPRRRDREAGRLIAALEVVSSSPGQPVSQLSGGNQQKTVMGRALAHDPQVLVLINPTAGVDVASKAALFGAIDAASSMAVVLVSDELEELAACDRVLVLFQGQVTQEFDAGWEDHELVAAIEGVDRNGE